MSYPGWIDDVDYEAPTSCGHCGEQISSSDDAAGYYATRDNHETTLHVGCVEEFDAQNPGRQLEDDKPGEQWPAEPQIASDSVMLQDRKAEWLGGYPI